MRRILAHLLVTTLAFQPVLASADNGFYFRTKPVSGEAAASIAAITGPTDVETHKDAYTTAQYAVGASGPTVWSVSGFPSGVQIDQNGKMLVDMGTEGSFNGLVKVQAGGASQQLAVTVNVRGTLVVVGQQNQTGHVHVDKSYPALTLQGNPLAPVTWTWSDGSSIPGGLALDPATGVISGIPEKGGIYNVALKAVDATGDDAVSGTFTIAVAGDLIISDAVVPGRVAVPLAGYAPTYTGTPYGTVHWSVSGGTLPAGLTMDDPTGLIHGTPTAATPNDGPLGLQIQALDDTKVPAFGPLPVTVYAPLAIQVPSSPLVMRSNQFSTLAAFDVLHNPASGGAWTAVGGLPSGVSLNTTTGQVYGTPSAVGTSTFSLSYADGAGAKAPVASAQLQVINGLTINKPLDAVGDTVGTMYAPTPSYAGNPVGQVVWTLVYDSGDPIPSGVYIQNASTGQVVGSSNYGSNTVAHYELSDQSGAPPVDSDQFNISFKSDFQVGQVADLNTRVGDTDYTPTPTVTNTRTGQDLSTDVKNMTWALVCQPPGIRYDQAGIAVGSDGRVGGTAGAPSRYSPATQTYQIYAIDSYHKPTPGQIGCPTYGDLATNTFAVNVLSPLSLADYTLHTHTGLTASYAAPVANGPVYPIHWSVISGSMPSGFTLATVTNDATTPVVTGSSTVPSDATLVIRGVDSSVHANAVDPSGHDVFSWNLHVINDATPTLGTTVAETGRTKVLHTIAAPAVNGSVSGAQHWTLKAGTGTGLLTDSSGNATGLSLNGTTGVISGTPVSPISTSVTLHFVDDAGGPGVDAQPFGVSILPALIIDNPAPTVSGTMVLNAHTGTAIVPTNPSIENGPTGTVTWQLNGVATLPAGVQFSTQTGVISGTPTDATSASGYQFPNVTLSVHDSATPVQALATSAPFALNVYPAIGVADSADVNWIRVGNAYKGVAPALSNGPQSPLSWSLLPASSVAGGVSVSGTGLSLDATGALVGTPTVAINGKLQYKVTDATNAVGIAVDPFLLDVEPLLTADAPANLVTYVNAAPSTQGFLGDNSTTVKNAATNGTRLTNPIVHNKPLGTMTFALANGTTLPAGLSVAPATGSIVGTPTTVTPATNVQIKVTDSSTFGDSAVTPPFTVQVLPAQTISSTSPDVIVRNALAMPTYAPPQPTTGVGAETWTDPNNTLPTGLSLDPKTGNVGGTPNATPGKFPVTLTATDQGQPPQVRTTKFNVTILAPLAIEQIAAQPLARTGVSFASTPAFVVDNVNAGYPVTWTLTTPIPGLAADPSTGALSGVPTTVGDYTLALSVKDDQGATATLGSQTPVVIHVQGPLSIAATKDQSAALNTALSVAAPVVGGNPTTPIVWAYSGSVPPGMTFHTDTGVLDGKPTKSGTFTFTPSLTDKTTARATGSATNVIVAPLTVTVSDRVAHVTQNSTVAPQTIVGVPAPTVVWALDPSTPQPSGMTFNSDGSFTGAPTTQGAYPIQLSFHDANGETAKVAPFTIVVRPALAISQVSNALIRAGLTGQVIQAPSVSGNPVTPLTWKLLGDALPGSLTLNKTLGTISGTPSNADVKTYAVQLNVTDATGATTTSPSFTITIKPIMVATAPATVIDHVGLAANPTASAPTLVNGVGPFTYALASGSLPGGLTLDPNSGSIVGTATSLGGPNTVTTTVTDTADGTTSTTSGYNVTVAPSFTASAPTLASVSHVGYPTMARPGVDSNAATPISWAFNASTNVPAGFSVDPKTGLISTTSSSSPGQYSIALTATDGTTATADTPSYQVTTLGPLTLAAPFNVSRPNVVASSASPLMLRYGTDAAVSVTGAFKATSAVGTTSYAWSTSPPIPSVNLSSGGVLSGTSYSQTTVTSGNLNVTGTDQSTSSTVAGSGQVTIAVPYAYYGSALSIPAYVTQAFEPGDTVAVAAPALGGTPVNPVLTLNTVSGSLPAGLAFNSDGSFSGTAGAVGGGTFTVTLKDDTGGTYMTPTFGLQTTNAVLASTAYPNGFSNSSGTQYGGVTGTFQALYDGVTSTTAGFGTSNPVQINFAQQVAFDGSIDTNLGSGYKVQYDQSGAGTYVDYSSGTVVGTNFRIVNTAGYPATIQSFRLGYKNQYPAYLPSITGTIVRPIVGMSYSATLDQLLATMNARPTESWTLVSGTVPAGMTLDTNAGTLSGTPTSFGDANLVMTVTDASGVASAPVTLVVSVQSNLQASTVYPASALSVGSGAANGQAPDSTSIPVATTYDASGVTFAPVKNYHYYNYADYNNYYSGVQYTYSNAVSFDGSLDVSNSDGSAPNYSVWYNVGSASSPSWKQYAVGTGPVTSTQFQVLASEGSPSIGLAKARLGYGSTFMPSLVSLTAASQQYLTVGTAVSTSLDVLFSTADASGSETWTLLSGTLPAGMSFDPVAGTLSGTPTTYGDAVLSFAVNDARGFASAPASVTLSVQSNLLASNVYPISAISVAGGATGSAGQDNTVIPVAAGYDNSTATVVPGKSYFYCTGGYYSYCGFDPQAGVQYNFASPVSFDGSVSVSRVDGSASNPAIYYNKGSASSPVWTKWSAGKVTASQFQIIESTASNLASARLGYGGAFPAYVPSITAASATVAQGRSASLDALMKPANVTGAEVWSVVGTAPTGITVSGATLQVAPSATSGPQTVSLSLTDGSGVTSAPQTLSVTITSTPTLMAASVTFTYGMDYSGTLATLLSATNVSSGATWTLSGAPMGLTASGTGTSATVASPASNGVVPGSYPVSVTVTNANGTTATQTLTMVVSPTITAATLSEVSTVGFYGNLTQGMLAAGGALSWSSTGFYGNDGTDSQGNLTISPTTPPGTYAGTVTVTSGGQSASATLTVTITAGPTLQAASDSAVTGAAYTSSALATLMGGTGIQSGAAWTVTGQPSGYAVSGTDTSAVLTAANGNSSQDGTYTVAVTVTNPDKGTATANLTLTLSSPSWTACAGEGGTCTVPGPATVRYGANGTYYTRMATDSIHCGTDAFGGDPTPNVSKSCSYYQTPEQANEQVTWTYCGQENDTCTVPSPTQVRYGANGSYLYENVSSSTSCTYSGFGGDPAPGVVKQCSYETITQKSASSSSSSSSSGTTQTASAAPTWTYCGVENQTCSFTGTRQVRYGVNGSYEYLTATGSTACTYTNFGGDPAPGVAKECDYSSASS